MTSRKQLSSLSFKWKNLSNESNVRENKRDREREEKKLKLTSTISRLHKLETFNRYNITNCFLIFKFVSFISYATRTANCLEMHFYQSHEIEMFINRNREGRRRREKNEERLYLNWRLFLCFKITIFFSHCGASYGFLAAVCEWKQP